MRRFHFLFISCCATTLLQGATYSVLADPHFSPYAGGEDLLTFHRMIEKGEGVFFARIPEGKNWISRLSRLSELLFVWTPLNEVTVVVQHEVFGHGYRARELGSSYAKVKGYSLEWPFPYGTGGGSTALMITSRLTTSQETALDSAGVEATAILANRLKLKWIQDQKVSPRQATLYLSAQQDITWYIQSINLFRAFSADQEIDDGHDMKNYIFWLNVTYPQSSLTVRQFKNQSLVTLADPFTYFSLYAWFYYIFTGREMKLPMIPLGIPFGNLKYLPGARLGLTPFGPEYYFENFFLSNNQPIYFYARYGKHAGNSYWGVGLEDASLFMRTERFALGLRGDLWRQPHYVTSKKVLAFHQLGHKLTFDRHHTDFSDDEIAFSNPTEHPHQRIGAALSLMTTYRLGKSACGLSLQLGGKTAGFLPGESLTGAIIARGGLSVDF